LDLIETLVAVFSEKKPALVSMCINEDIDLKSFERE
jgi:hypothetical protein